MNTKLASAMDKSDMDGNLAPAAVRTQDKRAAELEELRQRNLAKIIMQGHIDNMQEQEQGQGPGQSKPIKIKKETFYQQQKEQSELIKQQQMDATANLHSFRNANVTTTDDGKSQRKKQEMEAAAMMHNYRGKPEAILSHQVKKISTMGSRENLRHVEGFTPVSSLETGVNYNDAKNVFNGGLHTKTPMDPGNTNDTANDSASSGKEPVLQAEDSMDDFFASLDDEFMPSPADKKKPVLSTTDDINIPYDADIEALVHDSTDEQGAIMKKASESSNENSTESTGWVVLKEEKDESGNASSAPDLTNIHGDIAGNETKCATNKTLAPQAVRNIPQDSPPFAELIPPPRPTWMVENVTASFSLLTAANDAPPLGDGLGNHLLQNMAKQMQLVGQNALQGYIDGGVVQSLNNRFELLVTRDGKLPFQPLNRHVQVSQNKC